MLKYTHLWLKSCFVRQAEQSSQRRLMNQQLWQQESRFAPACFEGLCVGIHTAFWLRYRQSSVSRRLCVPELHTKLSLCRRREQLSAIHTSTGLRAGTPDWSHLTPRDIRNHSPRIASIKLTMLARAVFTPSLKIAGSTPFFSANKKRLCSNILRSHGLSLFPSLRHPQMDTSCDPWYRWRYRSGPRTSLNPALPARECVWPISFADLAIL